MEDPNTTRIVLLGKTGSGKSSLVNTILGEEVFEVNHSPNSPTKTCQSVCRHVNGCKLHIIDTPGFFDTDPYNKNTEPAVKCMTECAPGPHAFLILLKVEKYTEQEKAIISVIQRYFSDEALKFATVVFTHGDNLPEEMKIEDFVKQNPDLRKLVEKCGGRCHVCDNKYWNNEQDEYRSNRFQIQELLKTIDKTVEENNRGYYTNEMLKSAEDNLRQEEERIKLLPGNMSPDEIREQARSNVFKKILNRSPGTVIGILVGALLGGLVVTLVASLSGSVPLTVVLGVTAVIGGGVLGRHVASAHAETITELGQSVLKKAEPFLEEIKGLLKISSA